MERIAGIDEAGRGPLAGPVVAAAVILRDNGEGLAVRDSKQLGAEARDRLALAVRREAVCFGIGWADPAEIDALDILQATFLAMRRAVLALAVAPRALVVDGNRLPRLDGLGAALEARAIVRGDATVAPISAASILAKTVRDAYMRCMDERYPGYAFAIHKGYPTVMHRRLLAARGPCSLHRLSFAPVAAAAKRCE